MHVSVQGSVHYASNLVNPVIAPVARLVLLLKLANTAIDSDKVAEKIADEARDDTPQALDAVWEEEQVKFFADKGCGDSAITAHQRRFAGAVAPQYLNITTGGQH